MLIFRTNPFDRKTYSYDTDDVEDILGDEMDNNLHSNKRLINRHRNPQWKRTTICPFCDKKFNSQALIRNHLGFMGLDVREKKKEKNIKYIKKRRSDVKIVDLEEETIDELLQKLKI